MAVDSSERGRRAPTPAALSSLRPLTDGFRILPGPLAGQELTRVPARPAEVRVRLDRSRESALAGEPTQDYLAVRVDTRRLGFAVTDGVGSSFLGDVAAQVLAAHVADWLVDTAPADALGPALTAYLHGLAHEMADRIAAWPIPGSVSALVRSALDQQRAYGSEAMIACGVIDLSGDRHATVAVAWLGDARLRVIHRDGQVSNHCGQTADRWSSRLGPRGEVHSEVWPVAQIARVIACTDGLLPELDATVELPDDQLRERLDALAQRPGNDDLALVDVGLARNAMPPEQDDARAGLWRRLTEEPTGRHARTSVAGKTLRRLARAVAPAAPVSDPGHEPVRGDAPTAPAPATATATAPVPAPRPPALAEVAPPEGVRWQASEPRGQELSWTPVTGASSYAVEVSTEPTFAAPLLYAVRGTTFAVPPVGAQVFVRLRCVLDDAPGPWSPGFDLSRDAP